MLEQTIKFYKSNQANGFLSNFFPCQIIYLDVTWPSSEHIYQGLKYNHMKIWKTLSKIECPQNAADYVRGLEMDHVPEASLIYNMKIANTLKYSQSPELLSMLLETAPFRLVEDSPLDPFWGVGDKGDGKNMLGQILEELRGFFISCSSTSPKTHS